MAVRATTLGGHGLRCPHCRVDFRADSPVLIGVEPTLLCDSCLREVPPEPGILRVARSLALTEVPA